MVKDSASPLVQVPPRIVHNPDGATIDPQPIVQTEEYAADMRGMELTELMMEQQNYHQGVWTPHEMRRKERCGACRSTLYDKTNVPFLSYPRLTDEVNPIMDLVEGSVSGPIDPIADLAPFARPPPEVLARMPWRVFVRPFVGAYRDKYWRHPNRPCDVVWYTGGLYPCRPRSWPKPGVLAPHAVNNVFLPFNDDTTSNPWGIFQKPGPNGKMQLLDPNTEDTTQHTRLGQILDDEYGTQDFVQCVIELGDQEWKESSMNKECQKRRGNICCQGHPGGFKHRRFTCCDENSRSPGCVQNMEHQPDAMSYSELAHHWKMHHAQWSIRPARGAVVIDCEMRINLRGEQELIRVSMLDFYTGDTLMDALVYPDVPMRHLNTRYSGLTWKMLRHARQTKNCVYGRMGALKRIFDFVGPSKTVVLHGGRSDMLALRWDHKKIIDTQNLETRMVGPGGPRSLKALAQRILDRSIQNGAHDSLDDALATRDLCVWYAEHLPLSEKKPPLPQ